MYRKYPNLRKAITERNAMYNRQVELVEEYENRGDITVIRPVNPIQVGRMERNPQKLLNLYNEGYNCAAAIEFIQ